MANQPQDHELKQQTPPVPPTERPTDPQKLARRLLAPPPSVPRVSTPDGGPGGGCGSGSGEVIGRGAGWVGLVVVAEEE